MAARRRPSPLSGEWLRLRWVRRGERGRLRAALLRPTGEGMAVAERLGLRGEGRGGVVYIPGRCRAGHIYRAVLGPSPWAGLPAQARHGPRAGPARARRLPCQAVLGPCLAVPGHGPSGGPARNGHVYPRSTARFAFVE